MMADDAIAEASNEASPAPQTPGQQQPRLPAEQPSISMILQCSVGLVISCSPAELTRYDSPVVSRQIEFSGSHGHRTPSDIRV